MMPRLTDIFRGFYTRIRSLLGFTAEQSAGFAIGGAAQQALEPFFRALKYQTNHLFANEKLDIGHYVAAFFRGIITPEQLKENLRDFGIGEEFADILVAVSEQLLDPSSITMLKNRGEITHEEAIWRLGELGYHGQKAEEILKLGQYIPSVSDFVRFAVREVFSPEIAEKYGQFEDYPPEFEKYAQKAGLAPEYAKYYWAAHWELPSVSMGFEMYHRGIISHDELATLLRTLDVMPYWREKLIQLSETPFTRVDVRRMYATGVLTRDEVKRAYMDLGYSEEKAEKMTAWTCRESTASSRDLTKNEILSLYAEGAITAEECMGSIMGLGYAEEEAAMLMSLKDFQRVKEQISMMKSALKKPYIAGVIDRNDVLIYLEKAGIPAREVDMLLESWDLEKNVRTTLPSKSDVDAFFIRNLISENEYRAMLAALGYEDRIIEMYLVIAREKAEKAAPKEKK